MFLKRLYKIASRLLKINLALVFSLCIFWGCAENENGKTNYADTEPNGQELFMTHCSQCHRPDEDHLGPALKNVSNRWTDQQKLYRFIRNSQQVIAQDAYAKQLYEKWNRTYMQPFPDLKDGEIKAILDYCDR